MYRLHVQIVLKSGSFNPWNPQGLSRPVLGLLYLHVVLLTHKLCMLNSE